MARADESRGLRDEANVGPDPRRARELRPLKDLKWKVTDGEPDIRGWSVFASTGRELGVVDDLLVDTEAGEVVMLDVDLKRDDRHTLAPLRAAWIDRATKRVVVDARELEAGDATMPTLPRRGALSDDDVSRFNDGYVRAYGDRGYDADREYRLRRGDEELRFGAAREPALRPADVERPAPRRLLDESTALGATGAAAAGAAAVGGTHAFVESDRINRELADVPRDRDLRDRDLRDRDLRDRDARVARDLGAQQDAAMADATAADARRRETERREAERRAAQLRPEDAGAEDPMLAEREIDPRELDARVRIDEGATVDERAPVGGVRYDSPNYPRHDYGDLDDERRRDGERVVSRRPWADDARDASDARDARDVSAAEAERRADEVERRVYYRRADEPGQRP